MRDKIKVMGATISISELEKTLKEEEISGYENTPKMSLEEIEIAIKEGKVTADNKEGILDRLYEIGPHDPEENRERWNRVIAAKRAVREI